MTPMTAEEIADNVKMFETLIANMKAGKVFQFAAVYQGKCDSCDKIHNFDVSFVDVASPDGLPLMLGYIEILTDQIKMRVGHAAMFNEIQKHVAIAQSKQARAEGKLS